uniref:Uncharacterized protein n=1 Tax=Ciona intestinalis TaxID=7719 RepID=H2XMM4_CIOIN
MDHDYLSLPFVEYWADRQLVITIEQALAIEQATKAQHNFASSGTMKEDLG